MTIKKRLARSNIAMLVIPILTAAALALLGIGAVLVLLRGNLVTLHDAVEQIEDVLHGFKLTLLSSGGAIWLLAAGGMLCTKKYRRQGVTLLAGLAIGVLVGNVCLKNLIARPRPCWLDDSVFMLISVPTDYSFPSGHTLASAIGATVLTKTNRKFGWAAIPAAIIIPFSRLYLFVHFPSDILAGAVLGVAIGEAVYRAAGPRLRA